MLCNSLHRNCFAACESAFFRQVCSMMSSMLPLSLLFFQRPTLEVTRDLLGKNLCRAQGGQIVRLPVTEVEAYDGPDDLASHASRGMTPRNAVMFERGGVFYVYLCYGIHWMLNVVTGEKGWPGAVLIRGVGDFDGPGKLTKALRIRADMNGKPAEPQSGLWFEEGASVPEHQIVTKPRIGVGYAGPVWAEKPYRFLWDRSAQKPVFRGVVGMGDVARKPGTE